MKLEKVSVLLWLVTRELKNVAKPGKIPSLASAVCCRTI